MVSTRLYPNRVSVVAADAVVADHERLLDRRQTRYDWQHYIPLIERKLGALRNGALFADMPVPLNRLRQGLSFIELIRRRVNRSEMLPSRWFSPINFA